MKVKNLSLFFGLVAMPVLHGAAAACPEGQGGDDPESPPMSSTFDSHPKKKKSRMTFQEKKQCLINKKK